MKRTAIFVSALLLAASSYAQCGKVVWKKENGEIISVQTADGVSVITNQDGSGDCGNMEQAPKIIDTDGDGIADAEDKCPTVAGVASEGGCPVVKKKNQIDTDGDGVFDILDACPSVKGSILLKGCPDTDGDGIKDSEDACPSVKGVTAFNGCPDTDGDGIKDSEDACPTVKGLAAFKGCADTDGDGVADPDDACPSTKGLAALGGCADSDGDGVKDDADACPTVAGIAENKGCPEIKEEVKEVFKKALSGIQFYSGKSTLKPTSYSILNDIAGIMKDNPAYKLAMTGYTDSAGDETMNLNLSKKRAESAYNYLVEKGVTGDRMTHNGLGEENPVDTNATRAGRAKNRRVEFEVEF
ncbi:MAG: OmpA family protein [Cyclobacteriaceae bacterium]